MAAFSRMPPLQLHILAPDPATAARIGRALRVGEPDCTTQVVADSTTLLQAIKGDTGTGGVALAPPVCPSLRHELNNHLALIRMLAEILAETPGLSPQQASKAREISSAAEAAASAIRKAHTAPPSPR